MRARIGKGKQREPRNGLSQEAEVTEVGARRGDGLKEVMGGGGERQRREIGMVGEERGERRKGMGSTDEAERESDGGGAE